MFRNRKLGVFVALVICFLALFLVVYVLLQRHPAAQKTRAMIQTFGEFQSRLAEGNWPAVQEMLYSPLPTDGDGQRTSPEYIDRMAQVYPLQIENGRLMSCGYDVTNKIIEANPRFWVTFDYMIGQHWQGDTNSAQVAVHGSMR